MKNQLKFTFLTLMFLGMCFGYLDIFIPGEKPFSFETLHIFLFNLCSGGTILLYYTQGEKQLQLRAKLFLLFSASYAVLAFFKIYLPTIIIGLILAGIVESIRIEKFSVFPIDFFKSDVAVSKKFHQASLLCLSIGLLIASSVILNNEYLKYIQMFPKLTLNTFFLGFSFPLSLISMSVIFSYMPSKNKILVAVLKNIGFWSVNLGVIIFFIFILFQKLIPQLVVTTVLFLTVVMIFYLFYNLSDIMQQKNFLTSGISFLLVTAVTGILYIVLEFLPGYTSEKYKWLLRLHTLVSLYGWNLSGLSVICRYHDFPLKLHSRWLIWAHWIIVMILAPLSGYYKSCAVLTTLSYLIFLFILFFSPGKEHLVGTE